MKILIAIFLSLFLYYFSPSLGGEGAGISSPSIAEDSERDEKETDNSFFTTAKTGKQYRVLSFIEGAIIAAALILVFHFVVARKSARKNRQAKAKRELNSQNRIK